MRPLDIAKNMYLHFASVQEVKHYYGILAIYALAQTAKEEKSETTLRWVQEILARFPEKVEHPRYNFPSYRIGGNARAYALLHNILSDDTSQALVQRYAEEMLHEAPKDAQGILCMPNTAPDKIWIDVVTAATPYMLFAGKYFQRPEYIDFAIEQCFKMYDDLLDETGLLNQCRGFVAAGVKSKDHWSRGNGWGYVGLIELVQHLDKAHPRYDEAAKRFSALSKALLPYQTKNGLWRQEITEPMAYEESSGTGLILYGFGAGVRLGLLDERFKTAFEKGMQGLASRCIHTNFSTEGSCPGCLCPGTGEDKGEISAYIAEKQPFRDEPHSFGAIMLALNEAHRHGITDLKLRP